MKNLKSYLLLIIIAFSLGSCSKNETILHISDADKVQTATLSILQDNNFLNILHSLTEQSLLLKENNLDTITLERLNNKLARTIVNFSLFNPHFNELSVNEKKQVLENILSSENNKALLLNNVEISNNLNLLSSTFKSSKITTNGLTNKSFKVTREEIIDCLITTAFSILVNYGKELTDIGILFRGGAPINLIIEIGVDLIKKASPWWTVAALVGQFGYCLYDASQS